MRIGPYSTVSQAPSFTSRTHFKRETSRSEVRDIHKSCLNLYVFIAALAAYYYPFGALIAWRNRCSLVEIKLCSYSLKQCQEVGMEYT
jgi:hypothetical protein